MLYGHPGLRAAPETLARASSRHRDPHDTGVSGNDPFAALHAERSAGARLVPDLMRIHAYWMALGLPIHLLILYDDQTRTRVEGASLPVSRIVLCDVADLTPETIVQIDATARMVVADTLPDLESVKQRERS